MRMLEEASNTAARIVVPLALLAGLGAMGAAVWLLGCARWADRRMRR